MKSKTALVLFSLIVGMNAGTALSESNEAENRPDATSTSEQVARLIAESQKIAAVPRPENPKINIEFPTLELDMKPVLGPIEGKCNHDGPSRLVTQI